MDARTYIDTQVVGFELNGKRAAAMEARHAGQGRRREGATAARRLGHLWNGLTSDTTSRPVVAAIVAALLAAVVVG